MKSNKLIAILNLISSICFYVCSIISFVNGGDLGVAYLCLGSTFLCLGTVWLNKDKDKKAEEKAEDKKAEDKDK